MNIIIRASLHEVKRTDACLAFQRTSLQACLLSSLQACRLDSLHHSKLKTQHSKLYCFPPYAPCPMLPIILGSPSFKETDGVKPIDSSARVETVVLAQNFLLRMLLMGKRLPESPARAPKEEFSIGASERLPCAKDTVRNTSIL